MTYVPRTPTQPCPNCGSTNQQPKYKRLFSAQVRLECACGVSGPWEQDQLGSRSPWHYAADGWHKVFPLKPKTKQPPNRNSCIQ